MKVKKLTQCCETSINTKTTMSYWAPKVHQYKTLRKKEKEKEDGPKVLYINKTTITRKIIYKVNGVTAIYDTNLLVL
jgi:hypothetical protein